MGANNALRMLLVDDVVVPLRNEYGKNYCYLSESEADYTFRISYVPDDALVIRCDRFPNTGEVFFKGQNDECKRADYVLVSESKKVIMFFELKRSSDSAPLKKVIAQLKGAKCVMDYCASLSSSFLREHDIFVGYTYKYYKAVYTASRKRAFADTKTSNTSPETARTLPGDYAAFDWLLDN